MTHTDTSVPPPVHRQLAELGWRASVSLTFANEVWRCRLWASKGRGMRDSWALAGKWELDADAGVLQRRIAVAWGEVLAQVLGLEA